MDRPEPTAPRRPSWHAAYALLGFVQMGIAPILLPLSSRPGIEAGVTYGAFALAGLSAPALGAWSDRARQSRTVFIAGLLLGAAAMALTAVLPGLGWRLLLAFATGLGTMAASTTGTMLAVEASPRELWDAQIGALQSWGAAGQVAGLLVAGVLATGHADAAFLAGAAALAAAGAIGWVLAPRLPALAVRRARRRDVSARPAPGGEAASASPARHLHQTGHHGLAAMRAAAASPLGHFLGVWLVSYTATNAVAVLFPVAMVHEFGTSSTLAAAAYAAGITISLAVYRVAAKLDARAGAAHTLRLGLLARGAVLLAMVAFGLWYGAAVRWAVWPLLALFAATQVIWPLLNVSSNSLAVTLHPSDRGESLGLLNATSACGSVLGSVIGGALMQAAGFPALCGAAVAAVAASAAMLRRPSTAPSTLR
jgi:MFS family permease